MTLTTWLTIVLLCSLGAMSPGPSLAIVLRHTLAGGRRQGCAAAVAHGVGIGVYAWLCISGLGFLITTSALLFQTLQWAGAAYLVWLGIRGVTARRQPDAPLPEAPTTAHAARDGLMIVFLNPKVAIFFIALFSQVIGSHTGWIARLAYSMTALFIDMGWYLLVARLFSNPRWLARLRRNAIWVERFFGVLLLALAGRLVLEALLG